MRQVSKDACPKWYAYARRHQRELKVIGMSDQIAPGSEELRSGRMSTFFGTRSGKRLWSFWETFLTSPEIEGMLESDRGRKPMSKHQLTFLREMREME
jgi:hypothetical protein